MKRTNSFYNLLNEGLFQKYCKDAGPVQIINVIYQKKQDVRILRKRKIFDTIEIDFTGDFWEEKILLADLIEPISIRTSMQNIHGTLFTKDDRFEDLILEFNH